MSHSILFKICSWGILFASSFINCSVKGDERLYYYQDLKNKQLIDEASKLISEAQYIQADSILDGVFCIGHGCRFKYYYKAIVHSHYDSSSCYSYLRNAILAGHQKQYIQEDRFGINIDYDSLEASFMAFKNSIDTDHFKRLQQITMDDQAIRHRCQSIDCAPLIDKVDSLNLIILDSIVNEIGWPGFKEIGYFTPMEQSPQPILILLHSDEKTNDRYIPIIRYSCLRNNTPWSEYINLLCNKLIRYNINTDEVIIDFIPDYSMSHLKSGKVIPETIAIAKYLEMKNHDLQMVAVNSIDNRLLTELIYNNLEDSLRKRIHLAPTLVDHDNKDAIFLLSKFSSAALGPHLQINH